MRIIVADDEPQVGSAIRLLFEQEPCLQIKAEWDDLDSPAVGIDATKADLILVDWEMNSAINHTEWLQQLRCRQPGIKVIAMSGRPESRLQAVAAGVDIFVSKGDPPETLLRAVRSLSEDPDKKSKI